MSMNFTKSLSLVLCTLFATNVSAETENGCLTAGLYSELEGPIDGSVLPCTLADMFFFEGVGQQVSVRLGEPADFEVEEYYAVFKRYLQLKIRNAQGPMEAGEPGLLVLGMALIQQAQNPAKRKLYEAYIFHQFASKHTDSIDRSPVTDENLAHVIDSYFLRNLTPIGIINLGMLVCAVKYDQNNVPLERIINTVKFEECVDEL